MEVEKEEYEKEQSRLEKMKEEKALLAREEEERRKVRKNIIVLSVAWSNNVLKEFLQNIRAVIIQFV